MLEDYYHLSAETWSSLTSSYPPHDTSCLPVDHVGNSINGLHSHAKSAIYIQHLQGQMSVLDEPNVPGT
jgi:hypothetical protein